MGRTQVCTILLELGMDPNLVSGDGFSPIHLAASPEGAFLCLCDGCDGCDGACYCFGFLLAPLVCQLLVNAGAFLNVKSTEGKVALHYALFPEVATDAPNLDVVTFLIDRKG
jgi:ankyrin repeat protein